MSGVCQECGAEVPDGGACRNHFHALLQLESEVAGGPGEVPHFLAVSSYGLQHPQGMNYTAESLAGSRRNVADQLFIEHLLTRQNLSRTTATIYPPRIRRASGLHEPSRLPLAMKAPNEYACHPDWCRGCRRSGCRVFECRRRHAEVRD